MFAAQVNANLKTETTDELLGRKRSMHLTAFKYRIDEITDRLQARVPTRSSDWLASPKVEAHLSLQMPIWLAHLRSNVAFTVARLIDRAHKLLWKIGHLAPSESLPIKVAMTVPFGE